METTGAAATAAAEVTTRTKRSPQPAATTMMTAPVPATNRVIIAESQQDSPTIRSRREPKRGRERTKEGKNGHTRERKSEKRRGDRVGGWVQGSASAWRMVPTEILLEYYFVKESHARGKLLFIRLWTPLVDATTVECTPSKYFRMPRPPSRAATNHERVYPIELWPSTSFDVGSYFPTYCTLAVWNST